MLWVGSDPWVGAAGWEAPGAGVASGSFTFTGSAVGKRTARATASGSYAFVGAATGSTIKRGSGSGAFTYVGAAVGVALDNYPSGLTATPMSGTQINLVWDAFSGATGYDLERDGVVILTNYPFPFYSDNGLSPGVEYDYRVRAVL